MAQLPSGLHPSTPERDISHAVPDTGNEHEETLLEGVIDGHADSPVRTPGDIATANLVGNRAVRWLGGN